MSNKNETNDSDPTLERLFKGHRGPISGLSFSPDSSQLVSGGKDSTVMLWSFKKRTRAIKLPGHQEAVTGVHFLQAQSRIFASCSKDKSVRLWKNTIIQTSKEFRAHPSIVFSVHGSPDSTLLITASADKHVKMWNVAQQTFQGTFHGHTNWVKCARFSWDGRLVISCSEDKTVKLWDDTSSTCIHTFHEEGIPSHVEFHPNDKCFGVAVKNSVKIYDIRSKELIQVYNRVHSDAVNQIAFHHSGLFLVTGSSDGTSKVFDVIEGRVIYTLEGHYGAVTSVAFSPDGQLFATGGQDKRILVWKSNFYKKEELAVPLDNVIADVTSNQHTKTNNRIDEERSRRVDARKSIPQMELPEIEDSIQTSESDFEDARSITTDESNYMSPVKNIGKSECLGRHSLTPRGGPGRDHSLEADTASVSNTLATLKEDVLRIQGQLTEVLRSIERLEIRNNVLNKS